MILNSQRTIYSIDIQTAMMTGTQYKPLPNTTLNEKFNVYTSTVIDDTLYPKLNYFAIGIGGTSLINDNTIYKISKHKPIDGALFEHMPFIMRPINLDLTDEERANYRMRVEEVYDGITYACYYLKVVPTIKLRNGIFELTTNNDLTVLNLLSTNDSSILNPVPRNTDIVIDKSKNRYISKVIKLEFSLFQNEIDELDNVMDIIYGARKTITEIATCSGIDIDVGSNKESVFTQVNFFTEVALDTQSIIVNNKPFIRAIEIGGNEPLID